MEKEKLLERWRFLLKTPVDALAVRGVLLERLIILHRLNELGEQDIENVPLVKALEETNVLLRKVDNANQN